ncbi:MAG: hypothetical protein ACE15F_24375 [bacterium]
MRREPARLLWKCVADGLVERYLEVKNGYFAQGKPPAAPAALQQAARAYKARFSSIFDTGNTREAVKTTFG